MMWAQIAMAVGQGVIGGVQASAQWKAAKTNYKQMMNDADTILQEGKRESANIRDAADRFAKNQIMDFVSSGVTGEGTPALVTRETYTLGNEEADATLKAAEQQALDLRRQAKMTKHQGKIGIASSIFGSASQGASTYMSAKGK
jgi:hypothetical protein